MTEPPDMGPLQTATFQELCTEIIRRNEATVIIVLQETMGDPHGESYFILNNGSKMACLGMTVHATQFIEALIASSGTPFSPPGSEGE